MNNVNLTESLLVFQNSQGVESRGTIMRLSRDMVVFEVYNPYSIVQLSEVLRQLRIRRGDRVIYEGKAVVSNLVNTGMMLIVSATLVEPWLTMADLGPGEPLRKEVADFISDWERDSQGLVPDYRLSVSSISSFLEELNRWLAQIETAAGINEPGSRQELAREFAADVERQVLPKIAELFNDFENRAAVLDSAQIPTHKAFARRQLHPLIMCAPFNHRTFTKPLGYAGDYEMVNMMFRDRWEGASTYAKIINAFPILNDCAQAHRNRIDKLIGYLTTEAQRVVSTGRPLRILNVACGPAIEVQKFVRSSPFADQCQFHLLDFNAETLAYTRRCLQDAVRASGHLPDLVFIHKSVNDLLKEARGRKETTSDTYDLVYCAGLFDYLSDKICARLVELFARWTAPGGLLVVTNVHKRNPVRYFMEHLLEWYLIYRDHAQLLTLHSGSGNAEITEESTGINIFLEVRLPAQT